jgi:Flp pilus assembly pilin Flp
MNKLPFPLEGPTMIKFFKNFRKEESGAVTVDWVVLTAAVAALGGVVYTAVQDGASDLASDTGSFLATKTPT